jgi:hypothetical protein
VDDTRKQKQKNNTKRDTKKLTTVAFKMIPIVHNTQQAKLIKASENCQQSHFRSRSQNPVKNPCLSKQFGECYQKTNKKEDTDYVNDSYPSQHTVGDPQTQTLLWGFCQFLGPTKPSNYNIYGPKLKLYSAGICPFGECPKLKFYSGVFGPFWGLRGLWGSGAQNQILLWGHLSFWGGSQTQILIRGLLPISGPTVAFWGSGPKIKFDFGAFTHR